MATCEVGLFYCGGLMSAHLREHGPSRMRKLAEVETAKDLMAEAIEWSGFTRLWQEPKARAAADGKAIHSWELYEKAIRLAEAGIRSKTTT